MSILAPAKMRLWLELWKEEVMASVPKEDLKGKFLIIHGTSDDNVHFQNTIALVNELILQNKQFQTMYYPGRYHSIRKKSRNTREHIFTLIANFLFENL